MGRAFVFEGEASETPLWKYLEKDIGVRIECFVEYQWPFQAYDYVLTDITFRKEKGEKVFLQKVSPEFMNMFFEDILTELTEFMRARHEDELESENQNQHEYEYQDRL